MKKKSVVLENVSKQFRIYNQPIDRLKEVFSFRRRVHGSDFHALKNISLSIDEGEFVGVIGRNGAGKSTLLRIISGELTPTSGRVEVNGAVSLLQLGLGFDLELTGLENARFATKLLGHSDEAFERMKQDIIDFADIGEFIFRPVKTYSSGMYSRLSFAVGINIDPDILIADEVLAVGDLRFSQKCLRKMREFKDRGKTIIFVSHDIQSVNVFCDRAVWLHEGEAFMAGNTQEVTTAFYNYMTFGALPDRESLRAGSLADVGEPPAPVSVPLPEASIDATEWRELSSLPSIGNGVATINRIAMVMDETNLSAATVSGNEDVRLLLEVEVSGFVESPQIGIALYNKHGLPALHTNNDICGAPLTSLAPGQIATAEFRFKLPSLANGPYALSVGIQCGTEILHLVNEAYEFQVLRGDLKGTQCGYVIVEHESFELLHSYETPVRSAGAAE